MDRPLRAAGISPISLLVVHVQPKLPGAWRREFSASMMVLHVPSMFPALGNAGFVPEALKTTG